MFVRVLGWLLMVGVVLSGCTMQKRSVMPGWHVDLIGHKHQSKRNDGQACEDFDEASSRLISKSVRATQALPVQMADGSSPTEASIERYGLDVPMIPVASLKASPLPTKRAKARMPLRNSSVDLASATAVPNNIGFVRFLYFLFGLPLTLLGIICILLVGWEIGFLFVGVVCLIGGIAALKKAFTPRAKWLEPEDNPRADTLAQLKQARKNQWRRRIEERQQRRADHAQVRAEARERRRMRREAFFQSAYTRMAIGFFGILALYALLF